VSQNTDKKVERQKDEANSLSETFKSVGSAFIGVQSEEKRKQDFSQGKASHFIIAGVVVTVLFIFTLILVVSLVLP
jgi:uncharacterized membrane protein